MSLSYRFAAASMASSATPPRPMLASCYLLLLVFVAITHQAKAEGLGDKILLREGSMLRADYRNKQDDSSQNAPFKAPILQPNNDGASEAKYIELIKKLQVKVVAPARDLAHVMNRVGTEARSRVLAGKAPFAQSLKMSRPMLETYVGVKFLEQAEIQSYFKRNDQIRKIVDSCKKLFSERDRLDAGASAQLARMTAATMSREGEEEQERNYRLAYLVWENNQNLFMLETYLLLCAKLVPDELVDKLSGQLKLLL